MTRAFSCLLLVVFILIGAASAVAGERIMFVGNSLTGFNNLPGQFQARARELGRSPQVEEYLSFGKTLAYHFSRAEVVSALKTKKWDVVVLQEFSVGPLERPREFEDSVSKFIELIHSSPVNETTKVVLFQNWPLKDVDTIQALDGEYARAAVFGATIAPIGHVWNEVRARGKANLYVDDRHPSPSGSYLAVCVLLRSIYSVNVDPLSHLGSKSTTSAVVNGPLQPTAFFDLDIEVGSDVIEDIQRAVDSAVFP